MTNGMKGMFLHAALGAAMMYNNPYREHLNEHRRENPVTGKRLSKPKGQKYTYPDGFECWALNQKNADRKHNNWKRYEHI